MYSFHVYSLYCLTFCIFCKNVFLLSKPCYSYPGVIVYEYELKIGWGKSVSLPSQALPAPPPGHMAIRSKEVCLLF